MKLVSSSAYALAKDFTERAIDQKLIPLGKTPEECAVSTAKFFEAMYNYFLNSQGDFNKLG